MRSSPQLRADRLKITQAATNILMYIHKKSMASGLEQLDALVRCCRPAACKTSDDSSDVSSPVVLDFGYELHAEFHLIHACQKKEYTFR